MRILHLDTEKSWRGGEQQLFYLVNGLSQRKIENGIVARCRGESAGRFAEAGFTVTAIPYFGEGDIFAVARVRRIIRQFKPDLLHAHTGHTVSLAVFAARAFSLPVVITRRVDFLLSRNRISRWCYRQVERIIAISRGVENSLLNSGIPQDKIRVVPSGIDFAVYGDKPVPEAEVSALRKRLGIRPGELVVGTVAALAPHKDYPNLFRAARIVLRKFPEVHFLILGTGELAGELRHLTEELGIASRVIFAGFQPEILPWLAMLDIFVLSSYLEGMGTSILEAMARGKPVVATSVGGIPEVVLPEECGILVRPGNPEALAGGISRLLESAELRRQWGERARERARLFGNDKMVEGTREIYREVLGGPG